jgi:hypothetical protein
MMTRYYIYKRFLESQEVIKFLRFLDIYQSLKVFRKKEIVLDNVK